MEQSNVQYMIPKEDKNIDPLLIDVVTMKTGTIIKVQDQTISCEFKEEVCNDQNICLKWGGWCIKKGITENSKIILWIRKKLKIKM